MLFIHTSTLNAVKYIPRPRQTFNAPMKLLSSLAKPAGSCPGPRALYRYYTNQGREVQGTHSTRKLNEKLKHIEITKNQ